ncbi:MAG: prephenate dehydratase [Solobacterium sp.]|jgi:chorismate mutase/prephenate dehydratase|nr:prephenate dehydratase [Solobacterium sp.]MCH4223223.1 prephenate dehydratase [Solobacterium sp.]MCH4265858.1 prephenate dehydratase [Solobacterium sp.]
MTVKVGYLGRHGTFSEIAVMQYFNAQRYEPKNYTDFNTILNECDEGKLDCAMLPVENTTTGVIARTYDLFQHHHVHAVGEIVVPIREDLIVLPGTQMETLKEAYSHPEVISQCQNFFHAHPEIKPIACSDSAAAVEYVKQCNDPSKAALASRRAGEYYGLHSLRTEIQDSDTNMTRFLLVTAHEEQDPEADKISMMLVLKHEPGALYQALGALADKQINVTKLESRPIPGHAFQYLFYIDFKGNTEDPDVKEAIEGLKERCSECRLLGCYKAAVTV